MQCLHHFLFSSLFVDFDDAGVMAPALNLSKNKQDCAHFAEQSVHLRAMDWWKKHVFSEGRPAF